VWAFTGWGGLHLPFDSHFETPIPLELAHGRNGGTSISSTPGKLEAIDWTGLPTFCAELVVEKAGVLY
jgi:hypothetical protein